MTFCHIRAYITGIFFSSYQTRNELLTGNQPIWYLCGEGRRFSWQSEATCGKDKEPSPSRALTILSGKSPQSTSSDTLATHEVFSCHSIKSEGQRSTSILMSDSVESQTENSPWLSPAFLFSVFFTRDSWTSWSYCTVTGVGHQLLGVRDQWHV